MCAEPDIQILGSTVGAVCQKCYKPMGYKTVDAVLKSMNDAYYEKHKGKLVLENTQANLTPIDTKEIDRLLTEDAARWAKNLSEKQVEEATVIEEKRSYLAWVQKNIGSLTPKMYIYTAVSAVVIFVLAKLKGC